jgi:hypothetical protein
MADSPDPLPPPEPALERTSVEAYGGILAGIIGAIVTAWWAKAILLVVAAVLLVRVAFRSRWTIHWWRSAKWVTAIALVAFLGLIGWEPIAEDFHKKHPEVSIPWFSPHEGGAPAFRRPAPDDPVQSTYARVTYFCERRPIDQSQIEAFKKDRRAFAEALGYSIEFSDLPDNGLRFEMTANTPSTQLKMLIAKRIIMEIREVKGGLLITGIQDLQGSIFELLAIAPVDRNSDDVKKSAEAIEGLAGAAKGKCYVL